MLQQTLVSAVILYFQRFPGIDCLAKADVDEVLYLCPGLRYCSRARNLHKAAKTISEDMDDIIPDKIEELMALPWIGRSTAGAILSLSMGQSHPILDDNVKRILCRYKVLAG